jgi:serine protease Do
MAWLRKIAVIRIFAILAVAGGLLAGPIAKAQDSGETAPESREQLYAALRREAEQFQKWGNIVKLVVRLVGPTVVHIETDKVESRRAGGSRMVEEAGSGVILEINGNYYVLTNWHVVKGAELANITIELADGRHLHPASALKDEKTDIAVLAVSAKNLVAATVGDSASIEIGDFVLAVGSPFGLSHSVTYGIVSAKGRRDLDLGSKEVEFQDFIQTDAAINPGNSGGPLINLQGQVVGINTAIASNSGGNEGIGFSIPINMVMKITRQLIDNGRVVRAFLGVRLDSNYGAEEAERLGLIRPHGALINGITPNSPAQQAELQIGDVVIRFNGVAIEDDIHLTNVVSLTEVGREVPVVVQRAGQQFTVPVRVGNREQLEARAQTAPRQGPADPQQHSVEPSGALQ